MISSQMFRCGKPKPATFSTSSRCSAVGSNAGMPSACTRPFLLRGFWSSPDASRWRLRKAIEQEKPLAIALRREEHAIVATGDHLGEVPVEPDNRAPALQPRRAEILEPMLRALHAIEHALRSVRERHRGGFRAARHREVAEDDDVAREVAGKGIWIGR